MGWSIGYDETWKRDVGYGVPAFCDHPDCTKVIDRGLSYVCGAQPYGGEGGCGLYFCCQHQVDVAQQCERCSDGVEPFDAKADHPKWIRHKLTDASWQQWRDENPADTALLRDALSQAAPEGA